MSIEWYAPKPSFQDDFNEGYKVSYSSKSIRFNKNVVAKCQDFVLIGYDHEKHVLAFKPTSSPVGSRKIKQGKRGGFIGVGSKLATWLDERKIENKIFDVSWNLEGDYFETPPINKE